MRARPVIRAVIFDVGGVLDVPADRVAEEAARIELAAKLGLEVEEMWQRLYHSEAWKLARVGKISDAEFRSRALSPFGILDPAEQAAFAERLYADKEVAPEMRALLDELQGRTRLVIVSNATDTLEAVLADRFRVDHYFELIINSARVGYAKPEAKIFQLALEQLALRPEQTVFIDDQQHNVEAAAELGMHAVRFSSVGGLREYLAEVGVLAG